MLDLAGILGDLVDHLQRGPDRSFRIVLVRHRCAEQRQYAVAREILDRPAEALDHADDPGDRVADDHLQLLGVEPLAEGRGSHQIGEDHRDIAPFVAHVIVLARLRHGRILPTRQPIRSASDASSSASPSMAPRSRR